MNYKSQNFDFQTLKQSFKDWSQVLVITEGAADVFSSQPLVLLLVGSHILSVTQHRHVCLQSNYLTHSVRFTGIQGEFRLIAAPDLHLLP